VRSTQPARSVGSESPRRFLSTGARADKGAILAARIEAAAAAGCEVVVTETGEALRDKPSSSYRNIIRAGFSEVYVRANYLSSPEADTSGIA
jgi:hypothetical protein